MRRAVIDIGTNTVKLLVADVERGRISPVAFQDRTTRLGEGVQETKRLSQTAIDRTVAAVSEFAAAARKLAVTEIVVLATNAARAAVNGAEFAAAVRAQCGLAIAVITGQREAELVFRGVASDPVWAGQPLLVVDVGGGSAEVIQGQGGRIEHWRSLALGAVRLREKFGDNQLETLGRFLRTELAAALAGYDARGRTLIGTGGAITTLAAIYLAAGRSRAGGAGQASAEVDHAVLSLDTVRRLVTRLDALSLAERQRVRGLPPERADIIVAGGAVFVAVMELVGATELAVSTRNLRYGALLTG